MMTPQALAQRKALSKDNLIKGKLDAIWAKLPKNSEGKLDKNGYTKVFTALGCLLNPDLDRGAVQKLVEADFAKDAKGGVTLDQALFHAAAFELADIWTPDISANTYAEFLQTSFAALPSNVFN